MSTMTKCSTVHFDPVLHRALRMKAAETARSVSETVYDAVRENLSEDAEYLAAFEERLGEPLVRDEDMPKRLQADGRISELSTECQSVRRERPPHAGAI